MMRYLFLSLVLLWAMSLQAQPYNAAAGVRIGDGIGLSYKYNLSKYYAVEGMAQRKFNNPITPTTLVAMLQRNQALRGGMVNAYIGLGGHRTWTQQNNSYGVDGIVGIEGTLFYLNTSLDLRPFVSLSSPLQKVSTQVAFTVRYVLKENQKRNKQQSPYSPNNKPYKPIWT